MREKRGISSYAARRSLSITEQRGGESAKVTSEHFYFLLAAKTTREIRVPLAREGFEDTENLGVRESAILRDWRARPRWQHLRL